VIGPAAPGVWEVAMLLPVEAVKGPTVTTTGRIF
jgi:hypothetical protein